MAGQSRLPGGDMSEIDEIVLPGHDVFWSMNASGYSATVRLRGEKSFHRVLSQGKLRALKQQAIILGASNPGQYKKQASKCIKNGTGINDIALDKEQTKQIQFVRIVYMLEHMLKKLKGLQDFARGLVFENTSLNTIIASVRQLPDPLQEWKETKTILKESKVSASIAAEVGRVMRLPTQEMEANYYCQLLAPIAYHVSEWNLVFNKVEDAAATVLSNCRENGSRGLDYLFQGTKFIEEVVCKHRGKTGPVLDYRNDRLGCRDFVKSLTDSYYQQVKKYGVLILQVERPAHAYHVIVPLSLASSRNETRVVPRRSRLIFANDNGEFESHLKKMAVPCTEDGNSHDPFFVVHPECLTVREMDLLKSLIEVRLMTKKRTGENATEYAPVYVITSLPHLFTPENVNLGTLVRPVSTGNVTIEQYCNVTAYMKSIEYDAITGTRPECFVFHSKTPGAGKTSKIREVIETVCRNTGNVDDDECNGSSESVYLDSTTEELSVNDFQDQVTHVELSPDLFRNNFAIFDQLFLLVTDYYWIRKDHDIVTIPPIRHENPYKRRVLIFEVPCDELIEDFKRWDFPLALPENVEEQARHVTGLNSHFNVVELGITADVRENNLDDIIRDLLETMVSGERHEDAVQAGQNKREYYTTLTSRLYMIFFGADIHDEVSKNGRVFEMAEKYLDEMIRFLPDDDDERRNVLCLVLRSMFDIIPWLRFIGRDEKKHIMMRRQALIVCPQGLLEANDSGRDPRAWTFVIDDFGENMGVCKECVKRLVSSNRKMYFVVGTNVEGYPGECSQTGFLKAVMLSLMNMTDIENLLNDENDKMKEGGMNFLSAAVFAGISEHALMNELQLAKEGVLATYITGDKRKVREDHLKIKEAKPNDECDTLHDWLKIWYEKQEEMNFPGDYTDTKSRLLKEMSLDEDATDKVRLAWDDMTFIASMSLDTRITMTILGMVVKSFCHIVDVQEGNSGIGKSNSIKLLDVLLRTVGKYKISSSEDCKWKMCIIDFHGGVNQDYVREKLKQLYKDVSDDEHMIVVLEELNTSPAGGFALTHALNSVDRRFSFMGATNRLELLDPQTHDIIRCGIRQRIPEKVSDVRLCSKRHEEDANTPCFKYIDRSEFTYNVFPYPKSCECVVSQAEPTPRGEPDETEWLTGDERRIIESMVTYQLSTWVANCQRSEPEKKKDEGMHDVIGVPKKFAVVCNTLTELACQIFECARGFTKMRAILSYRDVQRFIVVFKVLLRMMEKRTKTTDYREALLRSVIVSFYITFCLRFQERVVVNGKDSMRGRLDNVTQDEKSKWIHDDSEEKTVVELRRLLLEMVLRKFGETLQENGKFLFQSGERFCGDDWRGEALRFAHYACFRYTVGINQKQCDDKYTRIIRFPALMFNLLLIKIAAKGFQEDSNAAVRSVLLLGDPAASKTMSCTLYRKMKERKAEKENHGSGVYTYLCNRTSDANSVLDQFSLSAEFIVKYGKIAINILDEVGLANLNKDYPMKVMHRIVDKGYEVTSGEYSEFVKSLIIQTSNYALDLALLNRGLLHCASMEDSARCDMREDVIEVRASRLCEQFVLGENEAFAKAVGNMLKKKNKVGYVEFSNEFQKEISTVDRQTNESQSRFKEVLKIVLEGKGQMDPIPMRPVFELRKHCLRKADDDTRLILPGLVLPFMDLRRFEGPQSRRERIYEVTNKVAAAMGVNGVVTMIELLGHVLEGKRRPVQSLLVRTENYEAGALLRVLMSVFGLDEIKRMEFPSRADKWLCQENGAMDERLFTVLTAGGDQTKVQFVVGNSEVIDGMLDVLNVNHPEEDDESWHPNVLCNGYPVKLKQSTEVIFVFIINEKDVHDTEAPDPIPLPLLDRLLHIYIDMELVTEEMNILEKKVSANMTKDPKRKRIPRLEFGKWKEYAALIDRHKQNRTRENEVALISDALRDGTSDVKQIWGDVLEMCDWLYPTEDSRYATVFTRASPQDELCFEKMRSVKWKFKVCNESEVCKAIDSSHRPDWVDKLTGYDVIVVRSTLFMSDYSRSALESDLLLRTLLRTFVSGLRPKVLLVYAVSNNKCPLSTIDIDWRVVWCENLARGMYEMTVEKILTVLKTREWTGVANDTDDKYLIKRMVDRLLESKVDTNRIPLDWLQTIALGNLKRQRADNIDPLDDDDVLKCIDKLRTSIEGRDMTVNLRREFLAIMERRTVGPRLKYWLTLVLGNARYLGGMKALSDSQKNKIEGLMNIVEKFWGRLKDCIDVTVADMNAGNGVVEFWKPIHAFFTERNGRYVDPDFIGYCEAVLGYVPFKSLFDRLVIPYATNKEDAEAVVMDAASWYATCHVAVTYAQKTEWIGTRLPSKVDIDVGLGDDPESVTYQRVFGRASGDYETLSELLNAYRDDQNSRIVTPFQGASLLFDKMISANDNIMRITSPTARSLLARYICYMHGVGNSGPEGVLSTFKGFVGSIRDEMILNDFMTKDIRCLLEDHKFCAYIKNGNERSFEAIDLREQIGTKIYFVEENGGDYTQGYSVKRDITITVDGNVSGQFNEILQRDRFRERLLGELGADYTEWDRAKRRFWDTQERRGCNLLHRLHEWVEVSGNKPIMIDEVDGVRGCFAEWVFNPNGELLLRQICALILASSDKIESETNVFKYILQIWSHPEPGQTDNQWTDVFWSVFQRMFVDQCGDNIRYPLRVIRETLRNVLSDDTWTAVKYCIPFMLQEGENGYTLCRFDKDVLPQIDRTIYRMIMFGSRDAEVVSYQNVLRFLRVIPFAKETRYLRKASEMTNVLVKRHSRQLNLLFVLLTFCEKWEDVQKHEQYYVDGQQPLSGFSDFYRYLDSGYGGGTRISAYDKLVAYVGAATYVHNGLTKAMRRISDDDEGMIYALFRQVHWERENFYVPLFDNFSMCNTVVVALVELGENLCGSREGTMALFRRAMNSLRTNDWLSRMTPVHILFDKDRGLWDMPANNMIEELLKDPPNEHGRLAFWQSIKENNGSEAADQSRVLDCLMWLFGRRDQPGRYTADNMGVNCNAFIRSLEGRLRAQ